MEKNSNIIQPIINFIVSGSITNVFGAMELVIKLITYRPMLDLFLRVYGSLNFDT